MAYVKNLLIYITPENKLNKECELTAKIQIDNAISLGQKDNLILVTNFPYEYHGVKSTIVSLDNYCAVRPRSIKTSIIPHLIDVGIIKHGHIYWNHDFDSWQLRNITEKELEMEGLDAGFTDYGWKDRWCMGSQFIKSSARDIYSWLHDAIFVNIEDEDILGRITARNTHNINSRIKKLNIRYQIGMRRVDENYKIADKPLKVLHFHPHKPGLLDIFMYGKSPIGKPLMPKRLIKIFNDYGIR